MPELNQTFDSNDSESFSAVLPKGKYVAEVVDSDLKQTKKGDGEYVQLTFSVLSGNRTGTTVIDRFNIDNPNPKAVEIGKASLARLCRAVNKPIIQRTEDLHGIPVTIVVDVEPAKGAYQESNRIVGYEPAPRGVAAAAPSTPSSAPWSS